MHSTRNFKNNIIQKKNKRKNIKQIAFCYINSVFRREKRGNFFEEMKIVM